MKRARRRIRAVSVERLLRDGHWGQLRRGISRQALAKILGTPSRWQRSTAELAAMAAGKSVAGWALSEVLIFDGWEFHFTDDITSPCVRLFTDDIDALGVGKQLKVDAWGLREGMTEAAVLAHLAAAGLSMERTAFPKAPSQIRLVLESGARLGLSDDAGFFAEGTPQNGHRLFCIEA